MPIKLPKNTRIYVFGSYLTVDNPNDLDILIVYDPKFVNPAIAYRKYKKLMNPLRTQTRLDLDLTLFTFMELEETEFLIKSKAVDIKQIPELSDFCEAI
ncbi:MAG: hypothetical protein D8M61_10340 [Ignavibacteriae bacterium]|nr:hypothetical protein [Ignavibacteriota bacterium]